MKIIKLETITGFRETVYDAANSGKYGDYPEDIYEFNKEVESGFSDGGQEWTSKNGCLSLQISSEHK